MGCTRIYIFRNVRSTRRMSEICMKNNKKTRWKHDFGVSDLPMTTWTDFVTDTPHLSIIFITMVTCIFLLLEVSAFEIKVKASLAVLVFLMKKQNLGSSTMHIISRDQSRLMRGNTKKKLLYVHNALEIDKTQKHRLCLNSIKSDRVKDIVKGIIFLKHSKILEIRSTEIIWKLCPKYRTKGQSPSAWVKDVAVFTVWWIYHKQFSQHSFDT